jgi:hypothetical protein
LNPLIWVHNYSVDEIPALEREALVEENGIFEKALSSRSGSAGSGPRGGYDTQAQLQQIRDDFLAEFPDFEHVAGGRSAKTGLPLKEEFIPGPDPLDPKFLSVRPDLTFENPTTGETVRIQTYTADAYGMIDEEAYAIQRILAFRDGWVIAIPKI